MSATVAYADALDFLAGVPSASVDAVITDPPYPEIDRPYGRMSEADWHVLMRGVVAECRRILKPSGSAVFILQPNSERVGRMRPSVKAAVWLGAPDCYRNQDRVLWAQSKANAMVDREDRALQYRPGGQAQRRGRMAAAQDERGGVTPFNLLPIANSNSADSAGSEGHGAGTPLPLAAWWTRYLCPPGGTVCDPFTGSGTMGIAAVEHGASFIGSEKILEYVEIARRRIGEAARQRLMRFDIEPAPVAAK